MIVDSHCHVSPVWYEPVETLLHQMDGVGVGQAVLIQLFGQYDNGYQQNCLARFPRRFASVVAVRVGEPDARERLSALKASGATGVRLRATNGSPGPDPLAIWKAAASLGLTVSVAGAPERFLDAEFEHVIRSLPDLVVVLEHLGGGPTPPADAAARALRGRVFALARYPNVALKVPGLGELVPRLPDVPSRGSPFAASARDLLRSALDHFGPDRLMWGSDFPPVAAREGYANALNLCRAAFADLRSYELDAIFGGTARRLFRLPATERRSAAV